MLGFTQVKKYINTRISIHFIIKCYSDRDITLNLGFIQMVQGSLSLVYIVIALILSGIFISKYLKLAMREFFFIGLALIGMAGPWFPEALGFVIIAITGGGLSDQFYLNSVIAIYIIFTAYLPVAIMSWLTAIMKLLNIKKRKLILIVLLIIFIAFEITFFTLAAINLELIGTFVDPFNSMESLFIEVFYISILIILLLSGFIFSIKSIKSKIPKVQLKGKILLIGFIMFIIGGLLPYLVYDLVGLIITRIIVLLSAVLIYIGFLLPNFILKLFKIED